MRSCGRERADLQGACARALARAARAAGAGSRRTVRAAARRFVRRHRRDAGYLGWVLRSVAASSALALTLLGLGTGTALAAATLFEARTGAANPLDGIDVGDQLNPAFGDLDGDGDLDLVSGQLGLGFVYFENTGSATSPAFVPRTGLANPLDGLEAGYRTATALGDLDGDGDLDFLVGTSSGQFAYFQNTGTATSPAFVRRTGASNPLNSARVNSAATPTLGDLDGDGDLDVVAGSFDGGFAYYRNTGSATSPAFSFALLSVTNFPDRLALGRYTRPVLGDLDGDGDLDLVFGGRYGAFRFVQNTGTATSPAFDVRSGALNPLDGQDVGNRSAPALADLDGDGDLDLVSGEYLGSFFDFENISGGFVARSGAANPLNAEVAGSFASTSLGDLDGDGDLDLVVGAQDGTFRHWANTGSAASPVFVARTGAANPLDGQDAGDFSTPSLADLDGDGDLDLVAGSQSGSFAYYQNTGSPTTPIFLLRVGAASPLDGLSVGLTSVPSLGDLDGDGDLDLLAGRDDGTLRYFENTGTRTSPAFVERVGAANPLNGQDVGVFSSPAMRDADGDGDLDVVTGNGPGTFAYFENTGHAASPAFVRRVGSANPLAGRDVGSYASPTLGDLDGDGDVDLLAGEQGGSFFFFENTILEPALSVYELTGPQNPLDGENGGASTTPSLGDLDGDGDLDLVVGRYDGALVYYQNTGSATKPQFVAAASPLAGEDVGFRAAPVLADLDGDGDLDLVSGIYDGSFAYFQNTGSATSPAFLARTGAASPLSGLAVGTFRSAPTLGDLDGDGDLDLVAGEFAGSFAYFQNTGTATSPAFAPRTGAANPLNGQTVVTPSTPTLGDVDEDGDLDLVAGTNAGSFAFYENTGSAKLPAFVSRTGTANPLDGKSSGGQSSPTLGDLDHDGDPDVISGSTSGSFTTFYLPEPPRGLMLGAGTLLLGGLARMRRGRDRDRA
ncbi:MAG: VCBS repeat-containing protein [Myxococcota bacterium]